jgi:hypothetical protein
MSTGQEAGRPAEPPAAPPAGPPAAPPAAPPAEPPAAPPAEAGTAPGSDLFRTAADAGGRETAPLTGSIAGAPDDRRRLEAEIERTREQLGATVQELVARADVKSRARAKAAEVAGRARSTTAQARKNAVARAGRVRGQVAGTAAAAWRKAAPEQVRRAVTRGAGDAQRPWVPLAIASGILFAAYLVVRQYERR